MDSDNFFLLQVDKHVTDVADSYLMKVYEITEDNKEAVEDPAILQEIINYYIQCNTEEETDECILPDVSKNDLVSLSDFKSEIDYIDDSNDDTEYTDEERSAVKAEEKYNNLNETQKKIVDALVQKVLKTSKETSDDSEIFGVSYIDNTDLLSDCDEKEETICGNEYNDLRKLAQVLTSTDRKKLRRAFKMPCEICGKMICQSNMKLHIMNVHTDKKKYECKLCPAKFKTARGLSAHTNAHFGIRPFQCDECPKLYTSYTALRAHKMDHQDRSHKCEVCGQAFTRKYSLTEHSRIHSADKSYNCKTCGKTITTASKYRLHMKRHEGLSPVFPCAYCPKRFTKISTMKVHMKKIHDINIVTRKMFFNNLPNMDTVTMEIPSI